MDDLQSTLQSILSDPAQMARIQAMAGALGLSPPEQQSDTPGDTAPSPEPDGQVLSLLGAVGQLHGTEERILSALRPGMSPEGQRKIDRALRAAKLSRLADLLLQQGLSHV